MFSEQPRRHFQKNPLLEVICQLRFPEILSIAAKPPVDFQEAIRKEFPQYKTLRETPPPKLAGTPGNLTLQNQPQTINHQFVSADGLRRVNLTSKFISFSSRSYDNWEDFAQDLDRPLAALIRVYAPAYFERVGLRYVNAFSRKALGLETVPFRDLFQDPYLGILAEEDVVETSVNRCSLDAEFALRGGARAKIHAGPGMLKQPGNSNPEVRFILDNDLYMPGKTELNLSAASMQILHQHADNLFLGAMTERLQNAMDPMEYI